MRNHIILTLLGCAVVSVTWSQTLKGKVTDINNQPLPSASVLADGGAKGVFADFDGNYSVQLAPGTHSVEFSFIGYLKESRQVELAAGQTLELNIRLEEDAVMIDDVVVIGYGVQRAKEVTGSITSVDSKQITAVQTPSFEAALQGQAAGVQVSQSSGIAGDRKSVV